MQTFDMMVIGSGPAGQRAAIQAAKSGRRVAVIERSEVVGGTSVNTGTIPSKTMREAVLHLSGYNYQDIYGSNYRVKEKIKKFAPRKPDAPDGTWRMQQADVDRVQEFRKCIECYLCQDVCHVLRDHGMHDEFIGPRFFVYAANLEMNPLDTESRTKDLRENDGIGYCNITKCCTKVCPEEIRITDNAIIPLKERVVDEFYDPLTMLFRKKRS